MSFGPKQVPQTCPHCHRPIPSPTLARCPVCNADLKAPGTVGKAIVEGMMDVIGDLKGEKKPLS